MIARSPEWWLSFHNKQNIMAVSIDTVYQRVLAIANKEQRGYVTPQEFNLFANQAQMKIFEQYFYDINQFDRGPGNHTTYADPMSMLEEKISIFKKRHQPVIVNDSFGRCTLGNDIYRLGNVLTFNNDVNTQYMEEVTQEELMLYERSPLTLPTKNRPVYERISDNTIKIYPSQSGALGISGAVVFNFTQNCSTTIDTDIITAAEGGNLSYIKVGMLVTGDNIASDTKVTEISGTSITISTNATASTASGDPLVDVPVSLTFTSNDIKCNYISRPSKVQWGYNVVNGKALNNVDSTVNFELHASEEVSLVYEILELAGISMQKEDARSAADSEIDKIIQQEKS